MDDLKTYILNENRTSMDVKEKFVKNNIDTLIRIAELMAEVTRLGGKVIYFGNGGSAADSQHLAAEHVNKLLFERPALSAISLTTDTSVITSIGNDIGFDHIFSRQIEAIGKKGDIAFGISTSGNSQNVILALKKAKEMNIHTVALTGGNGGKIVSEKLADITLNVENAKISSRIQETHIFAGHILIELMDKILMTK